LKNNATFIAQQLQAANTNIATREVFHSEDDSVKLLCCFYLHSDGVRERQYGSPKRLYPIVTLQGVTTQKTWT